MSIYRTGLAPLWVALGVMPAIAQSFSCGPLTPTYEVRDFNNRVVGIRCVKYFPVNDTVVWYGEGRWGSLTYRHLGMASGHPENFGYFGAAGDLPGNGAIANNFASYVTIAFTGNWPAPDVIHAGGNWNETWRKVKYTTYEPLPKPQSCSSISFDYYEARDAFEGATDSGIRCVLRTGGLFRPWFGTGQWSNISYTHIGLGSFPTNGGAAGSAGATDLCGLGQFCGEAVMGSLHIQALYEWLNRHWVFDGFQISGAWNEFWAPR
jgi:hypothetical protein